LTTASGFNLTTSYLSVGKIPMNDQKYTDAYSLLDLKPVMILQKNIKATLSTGVNNLTNSRYAASILPNAIGFGTAQPRSYPGNHVITED
jgi:iron complex outermembrane receptor protein